MNLYKITLNRADSSVHVMAEDLEEVVELLNSNNEQSLVHSIEVIESDILIASEEIDRYS